MKKLIFLSVFFANLVFTTFAFGTTRYVSTSGSGTAPYTSLATGATDIQTVIDVSIDGDIILVDDGTYTLSSNISITKGITLKSINGINNVIIDGNNSVRCFYINHADAIIERLTIQNGKNLGGFGGGVNIVDNGTVRFCLIKNNQARDGGGIALDNGGFVENCIIDSNIANNGSGSGYGGGIRLLNNGTAKNCLITNNVSAKYGGGVNIWNKGYVYNCTIVNNEAPHGAGIRTRNNSTVKNCIIYYNTGDDWELNGSGYSFVNCCTTSSLSLPGLNNISSLPQFISLTSGSEDYHLQASSPCINTGLNMSWMATAYDLDGNDRIYNTIVDMGCYEYNTPAIIDDDGDGIQNDDDDFPNDPNKAFLNYFPAEGYGSLAYEDLWPAKGDYDFNDVVVDYRFATVTNANNYVVDITGSFIVKASGAHFKNGFAFNLPNANTGLNTDLSVTGCAIEESYINLKPNGLEDHQSKPTVVVFDNIFNLLPHPGSGIGVNTENWAPAVPYDTITLILSPTQNTYDANDFLLTEWNPFIIVGMNRDIEVHLADMPSTDLMDISYFGTIDDDSNISTSRYYKTVNNLPWAINIPSSYDWPREKIEINWAYDHFIEWAESFGVDFDDWYLDLPGYRTNSNIYNPNP